MLVDGSLNPRSNYQQQSRCITLDITSTAGQGLYIRKPELSKTVHIAGVR